jgi:ABC-2 type transport system ATP-binding protein
MTSAVTLTSVSKSFGTKVAVDDLDLEIPEGTVYGFIGPNGSGKTTTIRMILRIFHPDRGRVAVLGSEGGAVADDRVGYLPEERGLYKKMKVGDVIEFFAHLKGLRNCRSDVESWLERLGIAETAGKRVDALSKGMSQKVQFVVAVITRPRLLVLDEPFSGLDPVNMEVLKDAILDLNRAGTTILFSTHDMHVAERMCDRVCMIFNGKKVLDGTLDEIQTVYGDDTVRLRVGQSQALAGLPGVSQVNDYGRYQELRLSKGADPQRILQLLLTRTSLDHFERTRPSLHDIFVRIAGPGSENGKTNGEGGNGHA